MSGKIPLVAIVGRTNVGKSTLFNAIVGRRLAIVEDEPGVTRDRTYVNVNRYEFPFTLVDTGGLVGEEDQGFADSVRDQALLAIEEADFILAVLDGLHGPHVLDADVVRCLRNSGKPVLWIINKCEKTSAAEAAVEFYALGIDEYMCVSAAHREGISELLAKMRNFLSEQFDSEASFPEVEGIRLAIVGRPNVGKSTLVNRILGNERVITSETSGTTRDSIDTEVIRDGERFILVDTAGLRKKARVPDSSIERFGTLRTLRALARCDVAVLIVDATAGPPSDQDAKIASVIHERGIPFLILVNKWDLIEKDHRTAKEFEKEVYQVFRFCQYAPVLFVSALTGKRCPSVLTKAKEIFSGAQHRFPTGELNRVMEGIFLKTPPPVYRGQPIKLFFATQVAVCPPTFILFVNHPKKLAYSYQRYIRNSLRKAYPYEGTNIKILLRKRTAKEDRLKQASGE